MDFVQFAFSRLWRCIVHLLMLPVYGLSRILPKDNNLWVFGAWFGDKYGDNPRFLFEYTNQYSQDIRPVWLSRNRKVIKTVRQLGYEAYYTYSIRGILYSAISGVCVVNQWMRDVNEFVPSPIIINLWHGVSLKKIGYDILTDTNAIPYRNLRKEVLKMIFPFKRYTEDARLMIACSEEDRGTFSTAFGMSMENIKITGYPRNDSFFTDYNYTELTREFVVLYAPTHRKEGKTNIAQILVEVLCELDEYLKTNAACLDIKLHYCHEKEIKFINGMVAGGEIERIRVLDDSDIGGDIYNVLGKYDILVTDYSSIYFDYLLTDRPVIFFPFDYEEYVAYDRDLYYDYDLVTPGPKCKTWDEVCEWITRFKEDPSLYKDERAKMKDKFHVYKDGNSSKRVFEEIIRLL